MAKPKGNQKVERRGGRRPNSGRPKGAVTKAKEDVRAVVVETISGWAPALLATLKTLADGGDRAAAEYLLNRLLGRPTERTELTGAAGTPLFDPSSVARVLDDPDALALACDLDARLALPDDHRPHPGGVRPPGE